MDEEEASEGAMAALLFLAPLLLLGTVAGQAQTEIEGCLQLGNATEGNFSVETTPQTYSANKTYLVTIKDGRNHSTGQYLLQALSSQNTSVGEWEEIPTENCSSINTAILNITKNTAHWTSPASNLSSVQIRVYLQLPDNIELKTFMLNRGAGTTVLPSTPKPNSVCRAQSSSLFLAALQLPLLLLTGTLLS